MTKEELARQAAKCFPPKVTTVKEEKAFIEGFVRGAEWMQAQMQDTNDGKALLYAVAKTEERTKREMIKKACEWITEHIDTPYEGEFIDDSPVASDYIEWCEKRLEYAKAIADAFKQAMEE